MSALMPSARRVRITDLQRAKADGERWPMLTSYDQYTAAIFDEAGIPVLLVGDSAANNLLAHETTVQVTLDEMIPLARAVVRATSRALIVADLPFGSYEDSPSQALASAVRMMKESGCSAVKFEGGARVASQIRHVVDAGIPVMAHIGFTPQSEHALGGYRVQGRGTAAERVVADAKAVEEAGAFAVVLEMVTGEVAARITSELTIPTIGIGAGPDCDAQVLVWTDMAGMRQGPMQRFVKQYGNAAEVIGQAARAYAEEVRGRVFPGPEHTFGATPPPPRSG